jgi:hypothetical protein
MYRSLKMTLEKQWDRHLCCVAFAFDNERRRATTNRVKNEKLNKQTNENTENPWKWKTYVSYNRQRSDAKRNNDRQVGCFNSHQSLMVHCYTVQLFVVVTTQHSSLDGGHVDCATVGWVEHSKGAINRWLRFPRLHSSTDNHGSRTEILGIHYLSWGPSKLTFHKME